MNWKRLYATLQIGFVVCLASFFSAGCYTVVVIGICRRLIGLSDGVSVFAIGLPFFIVLLAVFVKYLPKPLRKAGMLSDDPGNFGPWFKPRR
ncbi:hypothetical protein [Paraburkholderia phenazinium]|jgi:hypothetical protein|uniref:Uncharacterized protein n=1 Tax=Paraburkholderia phenazinium TaxID=60549 RepID=A0A1N6JI87_9BURK|nr:hypothetical protein [Paraburkholderia phenazinium]SIO44082.1 hypothetical protein SAMN05444165_3219 [Paraburkholderia phenazinium]